MRNHLNRLPLRWQLTLAYGAAVALVLTGTGVFVYVLLAAELDHDLERNLRAHSAQISGLLERSALAELPRTPGGVLEPEESFAQVVRPDGTVVIASAYPEVRLLSEDQLAAVLVSELLIDRPAHGAVDSVRLLASPVHTRGQDLIVVVGTSLDERGEELADLWQLEILALSAALVAACAVGYFIAGLALRPVERLRRRAAEITGDQLASAGPEPLPISEVDDELGRLGRTLNAMLGSIQLAQRSERQTLERERRFLADASHQLRTPLSIIKAEAELALAEPADPATLRAALVSTGQEADRLAGLADQLLTLAAGDEQRLALQCEPLQLAALLNAVAESHRQRAADDGRRISVLAPLGLSVTGSRFRLEQLLTCLIDNALLHGAGDIELVARSGAAGVQLLVRDSGAGFAADLAESAFERFRRSGSTPGAGLGLAIVQAIAEAHGGRARLEPGGGGCVVVDLPYDDLPHASPATRGPAGYR